MRSIRSSLPHVLHAGIASAVISTAAAVLWSRREHGQATAALNAVSHIVWGGEPPAGVGPGGRNLALGVSLHAGANLFWASVFEWLYGPAARRSRATACLGGLTVALLGFVVDYAVVPRRLRPGMEHYLSRGPLLGVYAALAVGFAGSAMASTPARDGAERAARRRPRPLLAAWRSPATDRGRIRT